MAENIASDDHVGLISIHCEAIHAQKLREQRVSMALDYILQWANTIQKKNKLFTCETHYRIIFFVQRNRFSLYLVVLLQNIVHLGHVLAGDDLDDVPLVV